MKNNCEKKKITVKIGPYLYTIIFNALDVDDTNIGQCFYHSQKIELRKQLANDVIRSTICHELIHAIIFDAGIELSEDMEEAICNALGGRLFALLKDNKEFVNKLIDGKLNA